MNVRTYSDTDYNNIKRLYMDKALYGGEFSEVRDSREILNKKIVQDPDAIWVAEDENGIIGSVSIVEDGRVAWLYRFVCTDDLAGITASLHLYKKAENVLKKRGHKEILVYSDPDSAMLDARYGDLGFTAGNSYRCFWREI